MDEIARLHCLKVMGVESWVLRTAAVPSVVDVAQPLLPTVSSVTERSDAGVALTWEQLQLQVKTCQKCRLAQTRTQTVFGSGSVQADWMLIGEAPGEQEDLQGAPFVGTAGLLLTEMLRAMGLTREQVYIANILKCRPPQNRDPRADEIVACQDYLSQQIAHIRPKIILAVGRIAAHHLLNTQETLAKLRGKVHHYQHIPLIVIYHPAYLLRSLSQKRKAWQDLQLALHTYQTGV